MRRGFIAAGCWTVDHIKLIDNWPEEEGVAEIVGTDKQGGGSAHNLGIDIRKLDPSMPVAAIGLLGQDADGDYLENLALQQGVDIQQLHRSDQAQTSYTDVLSVQSSGTRTFFHYPGTNNWLTPDHFSFKQSQAKILHLGLLGLHQQLDQQWNAHANGWVAVLQEAKRCGLKTNIEMVSIGSARNREICIPCLPYLDSLIVNDQEMGSLAGMQTNDGRHVDVGACEAAAKKVLTRGEMELVVVHYPQGAICVTRDKQVLRSQSVQMDTQNIVGSVGAGDAFAAGMLYAMHEDWNLSDALELAHAAAAVSLLSATSVGAMKNVQACLDYARQLG